MPAYRFIATSNPSDLLAAFSGQAYPVRIMVISSSRENVLLPVPSGIIVPPTNKDVNNYETAVVITVNSAAELSRIGENAKAICRNLKSVNDGFVIQDTNAPLTTWPLVYFDDGDNVFPTLAAAGSAVEWYAKNGDAPIIVGGVTYIATSAGVWQSDVNAPKNGEFVIPFGDSITAQMWRQINLTGSITVSNGIATLATSSAHAAPAGTTFKLALSPTVGYNKTHTVIDAPTSTTITFAAPPDAPASETVVSQIIWHNADKNFNSSHLNVMQHFCKHRFYMPFNGGVGADDSGEALLRLQSEVIDKKPARAIILLGTNDALSATSTDISGYVANMTSIVNQCLSAGIAVDLCTIPPFGTGNSSINNVTQVTYLLNANRWLRNFAAKTAGVKLHDIYRWMSDPTQSNGQARSGWTSDGTHFSALGAYWVGKRMAENYRAWLGPHPDLLPTSQADGWTYNTSSKNRIQNHMMQGAGPVATSWTTAYTGTGNVKTDSVVARTTAKDGDDLGNNQKSALNSTASGSAGTHLLYQDPSTRLTAGKTYVARAAVTLTKGSLTGMTCEFNVGFTVNGIARTVRDGLSLASVVDTENATINLVFETEPFVWPSGATVPLFYLRTTTAGSAADAAVEWGRVSLDEIA